MRRAVLAKEQDTADRWHLPSVVGGQIAQRMQILIPEGSLPANASIAPERSIASEPSSGIACSSNDS